MEYFEVGTPLSNKYYLGTSVGEIYGLHHGRKRFQEDVHIGLRAETDVEGLFLTGQVSQDEPWINILSSNIFIDFQDICLCGFAGAASGGLLCASSVLDRQLSLDLLALQRQVRREAAKKSV